MSTGSEAFSLSVCLDASRFSLLSVVMLRSKTSDVALIAVTSFESSLKK